MEIIVMTKEEVKSFISSAVKDTIDAMTVQSYPEWITPSQALIILNRRSRATLRELTQKYPTRTRVKNNRTEYSLIDIKKISEQIN